MMDQLEALMDRAALLDLVHRYAVTIDGRDLDGLTDCFAAEAVAEYAGGIRLQGREAIRDFMDRAFRDGIGLDTPSTHLMTNSLVDLHGEEAGLRTTAIAVLTNRPGKITVRGLRYSDRCVREGAGWRFRHRRHEVDWEFEADAVTVLKLAIGS